jgi:ABC-type polysaccharide transport system permease subunit
MQAARRVPWKEDLRRNKTVYLLFLPVFLYFFVVHYLPMFGIVMAFQDFSVVRGVFGSDWIGMENFVTLFIGDAFPNAIRNTAAMALFNLLLGFPAPILFALLITAMPGKTVKRICQTICYTPNFVAAMVVANLVILFLGRDGAITELLTALGLERQNWLANANPPVFWLINALMGVWQGFGFGSILFVAAIKNINGDLHEAAAIDGASRFQRIAFITLPNIVPMILMMLTIQLGFILKMGYDKILLIYMPQTYSVADCLYTYTYRQAFGTISDYGLAAASGLFQSIVGTVFLLASQKLSAQNNAIKLF